MLPIFISGIGTGVGKTVISAIVTEALHADYWKPIQAGFEDGTDALRVEELVSNSATVIHPEVYKLRMPASPHLAAKNEGIRIDIEKIKITLGTLITGYKYLVIEGAGGLMVPLNEHEFMLDLIHQLGARLILVSQNYLGSINHSLLSAAICKQKNIPVLGWIFNGEPAGYEEEIAAWSGYPILGCIPKFDRIDKASVSTQAAYIRDELLKHLRH